MNQLASHFLSKELLSDITFILLLFLAANRQPRILLVLGDCCLAGDLKKDDVPNIVRVQSMAFPHCLGGLTHITMSELPSHPPQLCPVAQNGVLCNWVAAGGRQKVGCQTKVA